MKIQIPARDSFLAPEGTHAAVCVEAKEHKTKKKNGTVEDGIRLVFALQTRAPTGIRYKVGRTYPSGDLNDLYDDLTVWLGDGIRNREFDMDSLIGEEANVTIVHHHNDKYAEPFRKIVSILPRQTGHESYEEAA